MTPRFTYIETEDGKYRLLNLAHLKMIDEIEDGHCRITFDSNFTIELHGVAADQFISKLLTESELADEADAVDKVRKRPRKVQSIKRADESQ